MNKIFNITLLLSIVGLVAYAYYYHTLGLEWSKDYLISFTNKTWSEIDFFREFYYYIGLFLSIFFLPFSLMMSWKLHMWYMFLIGSFAFGTTAYYVEILRYSFIVPTIIFFCVFWFFSITPKIKKKQLKQLKLEWILAKGKVIDTFTDYTVRVNGRPRIKAIVDVKNPHSWQIVRIETGGSFDPYFAVNLPQDIDIYFDRHDENKYVFDI